MNKVMMITGGSRGIGKSTILYFLNENWQIINLSRSPCELANVTNITVDLASPETLQAQVKVLRELIPHPSVISLIHNAGYLQNDSVQDVTLNTLQTTLAVNVMAPMLLNTAIIPQMLPGSSIIYVGSTLAEKAVPNCASYAVSKHAVKGLMKASCQDLADLDIMTCCINPGLTDTEMLKEHIPGAVINTMLQNKIIGRKLLSPDDIAKIIFFCVSTKALNGATINANTGEREI